MANARSLNRIPLQYNQTNGRQILHVAKLNLDTSEDYAVDAVGDGMPTLTGLKPFLVGYDYEINVAHTITLKGGNAAATTLRTWELKKETQYVFREYPIFKEGRPTRLIAAGVEGYPFWINVNAATAAETLEITLFFLYADSWI